MNKFFHQKHKQTKLKTSVKGQDSDKYPQRTLGLSMTFISILGSQLIRP